MTKALKTKKPEPIEQYENKPIKSMKTKPKNENNVNQKRTNSQMNSKPQINENKMAKEMSPFSLQTKKQVKTIFEWWIMWS